MGNARHYGPRKGNNVLRDEHEFKLGPWKPAGRRRWELRLFKFDQKQNRTIGKLFALVLDNQGVWHMWTVDETEWTSLATMGLLTAKVRFYQHLYAAGWRLKEGELKHATAAE